MEPILQVQHLTHTYSVGTPFQRSAVEDMSFDVYDGEFLGIIGHTGSGKSTLIQHLNGLLRPTSGQILLHGKDIWAEPKKIRDVRFQVGLVFQYPEYQLFEETVYKDIAFGPKNMGLSEEEMAVVTTFGKPAVEEASGLHFKIPVIQRVTKVSKAITGMQIGYTTDPARADGASIDNPVSIENESLMITKDFNLTNVDFYVEYMVTDPVQAVRHRSVYESIIKNLAQSYIRDTVGVYNVDDVITTGKTQIQERIKEQLTNRLVEENIGYGIYNVSIQDTEMPRDDVANAFKAVEDAKQGMETAINSAKKYQSENIPEAKAKADKLLQDAEAYKEQRINEANGQVARFEDTYAEYVKYPLITKKRMFYETMEEVLPDLKVIITGGNGTQTLLPLEPFSETASGSAAQTGGGN